MTRHLAATAVIEALVELRSDLTATWRRYGLCAEKPEDRFRDAVFEACERASRGDIRLTLLLGKKLAACIPHDNRRGNLTWFSNSPRTRRDEVVRLVDEALKRARAEQRANARIFA